MKPRRELLLFMLCLATLVTAFFHESLLAGKVLSPADVLLVSASFRSGPPDDFEPSNRLLMDPVLQFQPWLEFNRAMIRAGRVPLWNSFVGCGAPHLANGQSAVFDPFNLIAYLGSTPAAYAWMAAARLFTAGLGMFLLARLWHLHSWGRWFAGLLYPFTGFLVVWLQYPVTNVAIWMPWLFWATERLLRRPTRPGAAWLAILTSASVFGGHIQTTAHVLLAVGLFVVWKTRPWRPSRTRIRRLLACSAAVALGICLAAVQILPLAAYLTRSPVWSDRTQDLLPWWSPAPPRLLDTLCTALPYAYGSQRGGHPHLAPALGVHNLNESSGGYTGLVALLWLAPIALVTRRHSRLVRFLAALATFAFLAAFQIPPADNLLRALPVLNVTDNRRLTLWIAFAVPILAGIGLDRIHATHRLPRLFCASWLLAALLLMSAAITLPLAQSRLLARAIEHYTAAASHTPGADPATYGRRAERQVQQTLTFLPRYYSAAAVEISALALLAFLIRRNPGATVPLARPMIVALTVAELGLFGFNLNPAISPEIQNFEPPVVALLRQILPPHTRALGLGEELPPNVLMRFGLSDPRNYDSVELTRSLDWFAPLYSSTPGARSSRRDITWARAAGARDRLEESSVAAIVSVLPPPPGVFDRVEPVGNVWIARLNPRPFVTARSAQTSIDLSGDPDSPRILTDALAPDLLTIRITNTPGWTVTLDGQSATLAENASPFLQIAVPIGKHEISLAYKPDDFVVGVGLSLFAALAMILVLTGIGKSAIPGIMLQGLGRS